MPAMLHTMIGIVLMWCLMGVGSARASDRYECTRIVMGSAARLVFYAADEPTARRAEAAAFARLAELEQIMSDYRPTSELMQLRAQPTETPVPLSSDLLTVLWWSQQLAELTEGTFDPTVGPAVRVWRESRRTKTMPDDSALARALASIGHHRFRLDPSASAITLLIADIQLDLGGIGKGFAADEALRTLASLGITSALIDLGGDIAVSAPPPGRTGWEISIDDGRTHEPRTISLAHAAVATSGDLEQHVLIAGERYSHIIDPRTGLALTRSAAATVIARSATLADAIASAACVIAASAKSTDHARSQLDQLASRFDDLSITVAIDNDSPIAVGEFERATR